MPSEKVTAAGDGAALPMSGGWHSQWRVWHGGRNDTEVCEEH
jgi:hypothetical protein